jgi:hypothetical protein
MTGKETVAVGIGPAFWSIGASYPKNKNKQNK